MSSQSQDSAMESNAMPSAAEMASPSSNSSGSSSSSCPSDNSNPSTDSSIANSVKNNNLSVENNKSSISSGSDSDGGFVSGEEDFETAPEKPIVEDPDAETVEEPIEGDYSKGSLDFSIPKSVLQVENVLDVDDKDNEVVGNSKIGVLGGEKVEEESLMGGIGDLKVIGDEGSGEEVLGDKGLRENAISGELVKESGVSDKNVNLNEVLSSMDEGRCMPEKQEMKGVESKDEEGVEEKKSEMFLDVKHSVDVAEAKEGIEDGLKFTNGGDSVVEAINVNVLESGAATVGDVEKSKEFGIKGMGVSVDKSVSLDNGFGQISSDAEGPLDLKLVGVYESEKKFEPVTRGIAEDAEAGDVEEKKEFENKGMEVPVHKSASLDNGFDQISGDAQESVDKLVGVVESKISGEVESENKAMDVPDDKSASLDNGFDQTSGDAEELVDSELVGVAESEKTVELVMSDKVEDAEVEPNEQKIDAACMGEDENSNRVGVVETETIDMQDDLKIEAEADSGTKRNEPTVKIVADGAKLVPTDRLEGGDGYGTQTVDATAENAQTNAAYGAEHVKNGQTYGEQLEDGVLGKSSLPESAEVNSVSNANIRGEAEADEIHRAEEEGEIEGSVTDGETEGMIFGSSEAAKQFLEELEQESGVGSHLGAESARDHLQRIDGQIVTDSDEEVDTDEEGDGKELFDSAALAALLKAATGSGSDGGNITITSQDGSRLFSVERPAGLGSSLRSMKPAPRSNHPTLFTPNLTTGGETDINLTEEDKNKLEKLQQTRVKFLRLVHRLGHSPEDSVAAQVLYRMAIVAGRQTSQLFSLDTAKRTALQLEAERKDDLNFSLTILVIGKTGVGKSATINAIFGEEKAQINAFEPATTTVKEISGTVDGVNIRVFDSPGLKSSAIEQGFNRKILSSIKKLTKKCPPDIVLYVDRLDAQTRDLNDLPLLRSITSSLGPSIWRSAIVTLTHAASAPPDGPSGSPLSYEVFVAQRSHVVQQSIGQAVGDLRLMNPSLMNPVSLVENHPSCRKNRDGQKVLPNGQSWRPQLLLLCYSMKILSEVSSLSKPQDPFDHRKLFGFRVRSPPLPYLLSWLLQSRTHPKLATDQGGDNGDSDVDLDDMSDSDQEEEEDEYDQLPPFKPLRKSQITKLSKEQQRAYFEEYDYRVKLLQKKQWREELKRMREMKKKGKIGVEDYGYMGDDMNQENETPASVPVPLPDMVLPPSFDCDNPAFRYRFLEPTSQFLARPVLDTHGWDHDCGYDGVNLEQTLAIASQFPAAISVQMTKDKKEFNIHLDSSVSAKHGENGSSMAGFDIQNIGKQLAYILRGETKFKNFKKNKTAAGVSFTFLGENVATGIKVEDQIALGKRLILVGSTGTVRSQGDAAYGANLEVRLREADYPIGQDQSSLGLSLVKWRGDLALGANFQSQFSIGRGSKMAVRAGLNNKLSGQISVRTSSSEQLQIALVAIIPVFTAIYKSIFPGVSEKYSIY